MKSYIIIYLDLVGYSKNNEPIQVALFKKFQKQIHHVLYDEIIQEKCILIPTGDGMIIGLEDDALNSYLLSLDLVTDIIDWTKKNTVKVRSAIHVGEVNILKDINRNNNIIGNTINDAARMLTGADDGAIIISKTFYNKYLRKPDITMGNKYDINTTFSFILVDEDSVIDKHSYEHFVYNILIYKNEIEYGLGSKILNKFFTSIYSKDYPKKDNLNNRFFNKVKSCESITLFGIYHPNTPSILDKLEINDFKSVEINLYYASNDLQKHIEDFFSSNDENLNFTNKQVSIDKVKEWYKNHQYSKNIKLNVYEYKKFYPFGFSMLDYNIQAKGFIHISNYVPNIIPADTPYIEVEWKTKTMPPIYGFYFDYIQKNILLNKEIDKLL